MKRIIIISVILIIILDLVSCSNEKKRYSAEFLELFDTVTQIVAYSDNREEFEELAGFIYARLEEYHGLYNIYEDYETANIKTINENAGIAPVKVDSRIIDLLVFCKEMFELTEGRVNIAMGSVLEIWHEYRERGVESAENAKLPVHNVLEEAARHTNIEDIIIDNDNSTVYLRDGDMSIDVGAIAKGYAVEQAARLAAQEGYSSLLISVGGNVRATGGKEGNNTPWNVGVSDPHSENREVLHVLNINDFSLVTSGNYQRYYTVDGIRYNHIIAPDTLMPANHFTAVTVICQDSGLADALSTALYIMPFDEGAAFVEKLAEVEAVWIMPNREMKFSKNYNSYIAENKK